MLTSVPLPVKESSLQDHVVFVCRFIGFATIHSLLASQLFKNKIAAILGQESRHYRLIYNLLSLFLFGWVMAADRGSRVLYYAPGIWSLILYLCQLVILLILLSCLRQTGISRFLGLGKPERTTDELITGGWYSFVRHPLYFFSILFLVLNQVMTVQWLLLTVLSSAYFTIGALIEEKRLSARHGQTYRKYQSQVPFLLPRLHPNRLKN